MAHLDASLGKVFPFAGGGVFTERIVLGCLVFVVRLYVKYVFRIINGKLKKKMGGACFIRIE